MVIETIKEGIDTADKMMELYNKHIDRIIPWKEFKETLDELNKFRGNYSVESAALIGDIKTLMMDGMDSYFSASQNVFEWAGTVIPHLTMYIKLFDSYSAGIAETQKKLFVDVLSEGEKRMTDAQNDLGKSSSSFNSVAGKLTTLHGRFAVEFDEKSEYFQTKMSEIRLKGYAGGAWFGPIGVGIAAAVIEGKLIPEVKANMEKIETFYDTLNGKMQQAFMDIEKTKVNLVGEIQHIGNLKVKTKNANTYISMDEVPELRDMVIKAAQDLINQCEEYRKRHTNKTDLA